MNEPHSPDHLSASVLSRRAAIVRGATAAAGAVLGLEGFAASGKRTVVVWSERTAPKDVYPDDINGAIAEGLVRLRGWEVLTANIDEPDQGLRPELLNRTSVLIWWGHKRHGEVKDELVDRIVQRVKGEGMGFIGVHSCHFAKPFKRLMGTECSWRWYVADGSSLTVVVRAPDHPIAHGIKDFDLPKTERYGEPFKVPQPETVVFDGIYHRPDGTLESSRQGMTWTVEKGRVFYFQPGHETYPHMYNESVRHIMRNATRWAAAR